MPVPDLSGWQISYQTLDSLATGAKGDHVSIYSRLVRNSEEAHIAWVLAALTPWASIEGPLLPPGKGPKHFVPFITQAAREGIKAPNKLCDIITASHKNRLDILNLKRAVCANAPQASKRDYLAMTILKWDKLGGQWKLQLLYALLAEAVDKMAIRQDPSSNGKNPRTQVKRRGFRATMLLNPMQISSHSCRSGSNFSFTWMRWASQMPRR